MSLNVVWCSMDVDEADGLDCGKENGKMRDRWNLVGKSNIYGINIRFKRRRLGDDAPRLRLIH